MEFPDVAQPPGHRLKLMDSGRLKDARDFSRRAMDSAERAEEKETAATYAALSGLREALFGNADKARRSASLANEHPAGSDVQYGAALALAYAGDAGRARVLTDNLGKTFPENTIVQFNYLPTLHAKLALGRGNPSEAIEILRAATPSELGQTTFSTYGWTAMYPVFVRGEAYLAARQGSEAAAEFQKILEHRGIAPRIRISSRFGKTPTLTFPSSNNPSPSSRNCNNSGAQAPTGITSRNQFPIPERRGKRKREQETSLPSPSRRSSPTFQVAFNIHGWCFSELHCGSVGCPPRRPKRSCFWSCLRALSVGATFSPSLFLACSADAALSPSW